VASEITGRVLIYDIRDINAEPYTQIKTKITLGFRPILEIIGDKLANVPGK
jgi:hypothetical protein